MPAISSDGIVIIQDILERGEVSGRLIDTLSSQSKKILCLIGLIRLVPGLAETRVCGVLEGWYPDLGEIPEGYIPRHAMIELRSPEQCEPLNDNEDDFNAFWVEPRSLHPIRYRTLRREFEPGRDPDLFRRDQNLPKFDDIEAGCLLAAGHYVFGRRHYSVAIDVRRTLEGQIGEVIADWLAEVCQGTKKRTKNDWERTEGIALQGDVTAVLMPLHSQIYCLWPQIASLLAQKGRRQPMWLLDATLFTGRAPAYRIPSQLRYQIEMAVECAIESKKARMRSNPKPLRILILDDAIASARTAETVLLTLTREVAKAFAKRDLNPGKFAEAFSPIEWIRYFAVLNQMSHAQHVLWHNLKSVGDPPIPFILEEFIPFMGVPFYDESDCPNCGDRTRLNSLISRCLQCGAHSAARWAEELNGKLAPVAIDSPEFQKPKPVPLTNGISVLGMEAKSLRPIPVPLHADTAIWRFYKLMLLAYPPSDVLRSLANAYPGANAKDGEEVEYERYRWAVFEWCLRNWPRIVAGSSGSHFIECANREVARNTRLVEKILEGCSQEYRDRHIRQFVVHCIEVLAILEEQRQKGQNSRNVDREKRLTSLEMGLTLFFLNVTSGKDLDLPGISVSSYGHETASLTAGVIDSTDCTARSKDEHSALTELLNQLDLNAKRLDCYGPSLLRSIYSKATRPQRTASPVWALNAVAECLLRGRDPEKAPAGRHQLLPKLISKLLRRPPDLEDRLLVEGSLSTLIAGLEDILPYAHLGGLSEDAEKIKEYGKEVLRWLKAPPSSKESMNRPPALRRLGRLLDLDGNFIKTFNTLFHEEVIALHQLLLKQKEENTNGHLLDLEYIVDEDTKHCRVLTSVQKLIVCLGNLAIDPIVYCESRHNSRVIVQRIHEGPTPEKIVFRVLTGFASFRETFELISKGQSGGAERANLFTFGVEFEQICTHPTPIEVRAGFTAAFQLKVLSGFVPGRQR